MGIRKLKSQKECGEMKISFHGHSEREFFLILLLMETQQPI